jgi:hypothetical protein
MFIDILKRLIAKRLWLNIFYLNWAYILRILYLLDWAPPPNERRIWDKIFLKSAAPEWAPH